MIQEICQIRNNAISTIKSNPIFNETIRGLEVSRHIPATKSTPSTEFSLKNCRTVMEFSLSGSALKTFARSVTSLARIGNELVFQSSPSQVPAFSLHPSFQAIFYFCCSGNHFYVCWRMNLTCWK